VTAVRVDMGRASLAPGDLPCTLDGERIVNRRVEFAGRTYEITCVSMGNPHVVIFADNLAAIDLPREGRAIETSPLFPERTNVHVARVLRPDRLRMITWERGSGATRAYGTGACAVAVAGVVAKDTSRDVHVELPGGELEISYRPDGHVHKTGPAVEVFSGEWTGLTNLNPQI
jgi:diaminopimelate epimerase